MKNFNKWTFSITTIAVLLIAVIISVAIPKPNENAEGDKDVQQTDTVETTATETTEADPVETPEQTTKTQETKPQSTDDSTETAEQTTKEESKEEIVEETQPVTETEQPEIDPADDLAVKAVYLHAGAASSENTINYIIELAKTTELNAVVIDIKDGPIYYKSDVSYAKEYGLYYDTYDPVAVIQKLHDNDIYVIGRIVCFRDPLLAEKRSDIAIQTKDGKLWKENGETPWLNPYNEDARKYLLDLAKEAVDKGFDEIQLDYVRFPTGTGGKDYYGEDLPTKGEAINEFLDKAVEILKPLGINVSADIFGIVGLSEADGRYIGQELESIGLNIDSICPMIYPSHYANSTNNWSGNGQGSYINGVLYTAPDLNPYEIVYGTLIRMKERISKAEGYKAEVRPYLQAFTASYLPNGYYQKYGPDQIKQQIQAVYDAGYEEWILWDHNSSYPKDAFTKTETE